MSLSSLSCYPHDHHYHPIITIIITRLIILPHAWEQVYEIGRPLGVKMVWATHHSINFTNLILPYPSKTCNTINFFLLLNSGNYYQYTHLIGCNHYIILEVPTSSPISIYSWNFVWYLLPYHLRYPVNYYHIAELCRLSCYLETSGQTPDDHWQRL